ncbi:MAG TPA: hypothetical protein VGM39_26280 [Kofleriaceae bacterium]|jgi:ATP/maltotriose-dependent transcriptional regulator MalT
MATSNYDINVQLTLATTAELEGDYASALEFLQDAERLAAEQDSRTRERSAALQSLMISALAL